MNPFYCWIKFPSQTLGGMDGCVLCDMIMAMSRKSMPQTYGRDKASNLWERQRWEALRDGKPSSAWVWMLAVHAENPCHWFLLTPHNTHSLKIAPCKEFYKLVNLTLCSGIYNNPCLLVYLYGIIWLSGSAVHINPKSLFNCIWQTSWGSGVLQPLHWAKTTPPRLFPSQLFCISVCLSFLHPLAAQIWSIPVVCRTDKQMCLHMISFTLERKVENWCQEVNLFQRTTPPLHLCLLYLEVSQHGWWAQPTPSTLWNNFPLPQIWDTTENEVWIQLHARRCLHGGSRVLGVKATSLGADVSGDTFQFWWQLVYYLI